MKRMLVGGVSREKFGPVLSAAQTADDRPVWAEYSFSFQSQSDIKFRKKTAETREPRGPHPPPAGNGPLTGGGVARLPHRPPRSCR